MSTRVFNPVVMSGLNRLRASGSTDRRSTASPSYLTLTKVRRDLFGPVDHEECVRKVERELSHQLVIDTERWGFDFREDLPVQGHHKYSWTTVSAADVPQPFLGSCARVPLHRPIPVTPNTPQKIDDIYDEDNNITVNDLLERDDADLSERTSCIEIKQTIECTPKEQVQKSQYESKQSLITDFMKTRKRARSSFVSTKKISSNSDDCTSSVVPPAKIARRVKFS